MQRLAGKVAIVTGGGSGIGRATAQLFAEEGARVIVAEFDSKAGQGTVDLIRQTGGKAIFIQVDVSQSGQVQAMVQKTVDTYGRIDVLYNGAGILLFGTALDMSEKDWERIIAVNLTGTFLCCKYVIPHMIKGGGGSIINTSSSTGAYLANANAVGYVTSKGGVTLMTRCMAIDHARDQVRVNCIAPGPTDTPMLRNALNEQALKEFAATFPMKRLGTPREQAHAVLFLASDEASFVTGLTLAADGGQTVQI